MIYRIHNHSRWANRAAEVGTSLRVFVLDWVNLTRGGDGHKKGQRETPAFPVYNTAAGLADERAIILDMTGRQFARQPAGEDRARTLRNKLCIFQLGE